MSRQPGLNNFAGTLEVLAGGPLDARTVVSVKSDLTTSGNFAYPYIGMIVAVATEGKVYVLTDLDYTVEENWRLIGDSAEADNGVIIGYYDSLVDTFYLRKIVYITGEVVYENPVEPDTTNIYVDKDYYYTYIYNGLGYMILDPNCTYTAMPDHMPINDNSRFQIGKIVHYLGSENPGTHPFKTGYFYECIVDPTDLDYKTWRQVDVQPHGIPQYTTMPTTFGGYDTQVGDIVQYIGATDSEYTNGYFYKCVQVGAGAPYWEAISVQDGGGSSVDNIIEGYFNHANNLFYEDISFTTPISGEDKTLYISVDTNKTYRYNGTIFVRLDEETFDNIQKSALPTASNLNLGYIYQYIGFTNQNYTNGYFYKCVEDSETLGTYKWVAINVQAGGSGGGSLQKAITAAIEVGGIEVGDNFTVGTSYDDMWDALLNPTLYPTFTNPSASLSYSADTYYEVGTSIAAKSATASLNRGSISPAYGTSGYRSGEATNYALATSGADTEYSDSSTSSGTFSVPALTRATKGNIVLTATVSYAAGEQPKDSKGNNYDSPLAAGSKTASKTMQFIQPYYYGKSATSTVSNFTGLTKSVTAKGQKQFKFTTNNEYMVIAYDSSYGNLSSIIDPNGFETISGWTKSTLTVGGFSYYVYVANSATTDTNAQFTFKY